MLNGSRFADFASNADALCAQFKFGVEWEFFLFNGQRPCRLAEAEAFLNLIRLDLANTKSFLPR